MRMICYLHMSPVHHYIFGKSCIRGLSSLNTIFHFFWNRHAIFYTARCNGQKTPKLISDRRRNLQIVEEVTCREEINGFNRWR